MKEEPSSEDAPTTATHLPHARPPALQCMVKGRVPQLMQA
eukprot:CAMPEP_0182826686 /NCGR_PEP_ID=MMETSP0006_2-20121128/16509_1 /TAXON_ID=97485 /ORGANISM="Prymnesium parvum, Strain Texoma1" /LENGTH=39 /DNA_ID= /DNA_START= /DNA_END= /DNA_ORIENTATION=